MMPPANRLSLNTLLVGVLTVSAQARFTWITNTGSIAMAGVYPSGPSIRTMAVAES